MKLSDLILISSSYHHEDGLPNVLGDSFLVLENTVYRNIRQVAKSIGVEFVPAHADYQSLSLLQLEEMLELKKIPYVPTFKYFNEIETSKPQQFTAEEIPISARSYHFHDSCHAIADRLLIPKLSDGEKEFALKSLICESFANATESFATLFNLNPYSTTFYEFNSHHETSPKHQQIAFSLVQTLGLKNVFKLQLFSYLYSNFLYDSLSYSGFKVVLSKIFRDLVIPKSQLKNCHMIFLEGFNLSETFRLETNSFFFKNSGIKTDFFKLLDFDFQSKLNKSPNLLKKVDELCDVVVFGKYSRYAQSLSKAISTAEAIRKVG